MGPVNLLGVEPQVVVLGLPEGQLIVLEVVAAAEDKEPVGGAIAQRRQLHRPLFLLLLPAEIALAHQLLPDTLKLLLGGGPLQLRDGRFQIDQLLLPFGDELL